ncbi:unnamed protein product [Pylaiella littoralis]
MGRKRKRGRTLSSPPEVHEPTTLSPAEAAAAAAAANPSSKSTTATSPGPKRHTLVLEPTSAKDGATADETMQREDGDDDSDGLPGIPWALPPEPDEEDEENEEEEEEEGEEDEEDEEQEVVEGETDAAGGSGSSSLSSTPISDPNNRWKQHPDRRRKLAGGGGGGGGGQSNNSSNDSSGKLGGKSGGWAKTNSRAERGRHAGVGGGGWGFAENGTAHASLEEAGEDGVPLGSDGYYGPRENAPPPCTVFAPCEGKVHRVGGRSSSTSPASLPALVVGLGPREQLCFVGAALVRCGRGQADLSGYPLLPAAWGPYVTAHSPRWMSLLVVRALDTEDYLDAVAHGDSSSSRDSGRGDSDAAEDDTVENEIEEAIDRIAENFPVVVVFRSLSRNGPLAFLSAQADADALYGQDMVVGTRSVSAAKSTPPRGDHDAVQTPEGGGGEREQEEDAVWSATDGTAHVASGRKGDVHDSSWEATASVSLLLAAELQLPGMQVVVTDVAGLRPFTVSQGWADIVNAILAAPPPPTGGACSGSVLVCGAKGVGKSSLCRFLVNRLLGRHREVAYMDCDLGQPEFTPPGQVSLHRLQTPVVAPPHANIRQPQLAYFIGTTSSKPEPLLYSAAVRALAEHAGAGATSAGGQQHQQQRSPSFFASDAPLPAPLVVNTDGWVKGMGEDLLGAVIDAVRPRHIVQILGTSTAKTFELDLNRLPEGCEVHRVDAWSPPPVLVGGPPVPSRPSPQDQRTLRLVAYFLGQSGGGGDRDDDSALVRGVASESSRKFVSPIAAALPDAVGKLEDLITTGKGSGGGGDGGGGGGGGGRSRSASVRGGKVYDQEHEVAALLAAASPRRVPWRAVQIRVMVGSVSPSFVLHALNGALVGLVTMPKQPGGGGGVGFAGSAEPPAGEGLICLAETPLAPCVGLGIVRSVDVDKRVLYVLTPEPSEVLKDVNVLVMGSLQLPMVMLYDPSLCAHPYFSSEAVGGGVIKSRNNLLRRGVR